MKAIRTTIAKFANSFDLKDWSALKAVLADDLQLDYSDLQGVKENSSSSNYVQKRMDALSALKTQHLFSNLDIEVKGNKASCQASALIFRCHGEKSFHSHAIYDFELIKIVNDWRISTICQHILWNEGDSSIHSNTK